MCSRPAYTNGAGHLVLKPVPADPSIKYGGISIAEGYQATLSEREVMYPDAKN